jgi:hypothetical protein
MQNEDGSYFSDLTEAIGSGWNRFWFTPADPLLCCVLRIAVGVIAVLHFACLGIELERWYGASGVLPHSAVTALLGALGAETAYRYSYLGYLSGSVELWIVHAAALVSAAAFAAGLFTRVSGILTLIVVLAYVHRVPQVAGHVEPVLAFMLAYLTLAPSGRFLSVDALLAKRRNADAPQQADDPREPSVLANIGLRLIQVHVALFYLMMGLTKLYGDAWWDGNAIWLLLAQTESRPLDLTGLRRWGQWGEYVINIWTHSIVYFELAFPVLIWNRLARPLLVGIGMVIWVSIILASGLLVFGLAMIVCTSAFLSPSSYRPPT